MPPISLTGIKPTGNPHIGNYFGMYKPALALTQKYLGMYFVADLHALTTTPDRKELQGLIYDGSPPVVIALGLDVEKSIFFRQSDIPEIPECTWLLSCVTPKGTFEPRVMPIKPRWIRTWKPVATPMTAKMPAFIITRC
jgi:tryptophanyl-tRNA synthetase